MPTSVDQTDIPFHRQTKILTSHKVKASVVFSCIMKNLPVVLHGKLRVSELLSGPSNVIQWIKLSTSGATSIGLTSLLPRSKLCKRSPEIKNRTTVIVSY